MDELVTELKNLNKLLVLFLTQGKTQAATIAILDKAGFKPKAISQLLGAPLNSVTKEVSRSRKKK